MHLVINKSKHGKKIYSSVLLRESYRENGKVKKRTIANLSKCTKEEIEAMRLALKYKGKLTELINIDEDIKLEQGISVGAVWLLNVLSERLGISKALGKGIKGKLALWQVISRVIGQGSRLSSVRLAQEHASIETLGIERGFDENDLYENLKWLSKNQEEIEEKLYQLRRIKEGEIKLFLYDVTSSYLEGEANYFGSYGYNRDKKKGKKQIVIGLLCDEEGMPVSVEVFKGNTSDIKTFGAQVKKVAERFGCKEVTFVGDRGMIKSGQIGQLEAEGFNYITAINKSQIKGLIDKGVIDVGIFDDRLCEVEEGSVRYILRRNPERQAEMRLNREEKVCYIEKKVKERNEYLKEHKRAKEEVALKNIKKLIGKLKVDKWLDVRVKDRELYLFRDEEELEKESMLDGCYVIKTDLKKKSSAKETIHERYKDLQLVEQAFRNCKSTLEVRPVYVRTADSTRGHVFIVMLSYMLIKYLEKAWENINLTVPEGISILSQICSVKLIFKDKTECLKIPLPTGRAKELLEAVEIKLPPVLPVRKYNVVTRKKLGK